MTFSKNFPPAKSPNALLPLRGAARSRGDREPKRCPKAGHPSTTSPHPLPATTPPKLSRPTRSSAFPPRSTWTASAPCDSAPHLPIAVEAGPHAAHDSLDCVQPAAAFPRPACWQGLGQAPAVAEAGAPGADFLLGLGLGEGVTRLLPVGICAGNAFVRMPGPPPVKQAGARSTFVLMRGPTPEMRGPTPEISGH